MITITACAVGYDITQNGRKPGSLRPSEPEDTCTRKIAGSVSDVHQIIGRLKRPYKAAA